MPSTGSSKVANNLIILFLSCKNGLSASFACSYEVGWMILRVVLFQVVLLQRFMENIFQEVGSICHAFCRKSETRAAVVREEKEFSLSSCLRSPCSKRRINRREKKNKFGTPQRHETQKAARQLRLMYPSELRTDMGSGSTGEERGYTHNLPGR